MSRVSLMASRRSATVSWIPRRLTQLPHLRGLQATKARQIWGLVMGHASCGANVQGLKFRFFA